MKRTLSLATIFAAVWLVSVALAETGNELFQKALVKERSEGNLKEAIKLYQQVVDKYGKDRALAAKALVAIGESQEKLGEAEARKTYERIVREYRDQKEAVAAARAHLDASAGTAQTLRQTTTLVWAGPNVDDEGTVSSDGRYISYPDWNTGNLGVHDLVTGTDRAITTAGTWKKGETAFAEESVISRDGKQIAYGWYEEKTNRFDLRVANVTGDANPQKIFESAEMRFLMPEDWSPDGKWIAVHMEPENSSAQTGQPARPGMKAAIAMVGVQDGSLRVLKTTDWSGPSHGMWKALFSPDGKYLAYDRATGSGNDQRGVYVMELASGREVAVAASGWWSDQLAGWSPNGKQILFTNKRTGTIGLWAIAFTGGMPQGQAELIKPDLGSGSVLAMAAGGALYYAVGSSRDLPSIQVAGFDMATGKLTSQPAALNNGASGEGGYSPKWSPDGKRLAYLSQKKAGSGWEYSIKIYNTAETRDVRELRPTALMPYDLRWTPDGGFLLWDDANGLHRVDLQSGEASLLAARPKGTGLTRIELSPDGKTLYYVRKDGGEGACLALDLMSGKEREIIRRANLRGLYLSPDGAYLASGITDPAGKTKALLIIPVDGGLPREVVRVTGETEVEPGMEWAPDSKSVLFQKPVGPNVELWQGFVDGHESHRINEKLEPALAQGKIRISPDGRRIALAFSDTQRSPGQIMVLDHFLPAAR